MQCAYHAKKPTPNQTGQPQYLTITAKSSKQTILTPPPPFFTDLKKNTRPHVQREHVIVAACRCDDAVHQVAAIHPLGHNHQVTTGKRTQADVPTDWNTEIETKVTADCPPPRETPDNRCPPPLPPLPISTNIKRLMPSPHPRLLIGRNANLLQGVGVRHFDEGANFSQKIFLGTSRNQRSNRLCHHRSALVANQIALNKVVRVTGIPEVRNNTIARTHAQHSFGISRYKKIRARQTHMIRKTSYIPGAWRGRRCQIRRAPARHQARGRRPR